MKFFQNLKGGSQPKAVRTLRHTAFGWLAFVLVAAAVLVGGGLYLLHSSKNSSDKISPSVWDDSGQSADLPVALNSENSREYSNADLKFSFRYPNDMKASNFTDDNGSEVILIQNSSAGQGFQIIISDYDEPGATLTSEKIKADIPDLTIKDEQPVVLGSVGQGLAFRSDNESFGDDSREVWFVLNNHFYQISTYAHLDPLLKSVLATWKFY